MLKMAVASECLKAAGRGDSWVSKEMAVGKLLSSWFHYETSLISGWCHHARTIFTLTMHLKIYRELGKGWGLDEEWDFFFPLNRDQEDFFSIFARWLFFFLQSTRLRHTLPCSHTLPQSWRHPWSGLSLICFCGHTLWVEGTEEVINTLWFPGNVLMYVCVWVCIPGFLHMLVPTHTAGWSHGDGPVSSLHTGFVAHCT